MAFLDDRVWCHPKWIALSPDAAWVGIKAICYAHGFVTQGRVTADALSIIGATDEIVDEMIAAGLWERSARYGNALVIHDWSDYNDDANAERKRAQTRERVRRHRARNAPDALQGNAGNGVTSGVTESVTSRARASDSESESEVREPLTRPADGSETLTCRNCGADVEPNRACPSCGVNPRAAGTNPRAIAGRERTQAEREQTERHDALMAQLVVAVGEWQRMDSLTFHELLDGIERDNGTRLTDRDRDQLWDIALIAQREEAQP